MTAQRLHPRDGIHPMVPRIRAMPRSWRRRSKKTITSGEATRQHMELARTLRERHGLDFDGEYWGFPGWPNSPAYVFANPVWDYDIPPDPTNEAAIIEAYRQATAVGGPIAYTGELVARSHLPPRLLLAGLNHLRRAGFATAHQSRGGWMMVKIGGV